MRRVSHGYTIVEVIIFLAVSGFLLVTSLTFLSGREGHARFSQSMRNVQSKIQDWVNDVPTGFAGGTSGIINGDVYCTVNGGGLQIKDTGTPPNDPDCVYLGKAIQFTDSTYAANSSQASKIYAYSIFGRRTVTSGSGDRLTSNLIEATPTAAVGVPSYSGGSVNFTDNYTIGGGAKVLSVKSTAVDSAGASVAGTSHLAGFYLSFNQLSANRNGSQDLRSYTYNMPDNQQPGTDNIPNNTVDECISMAAGSTCAKTPLSLPDDQWPRGMKDWVICFGNDSNDDTALLTITSSNGLGAKTKLEFTPCT